MEKILRYTDPTVPLARARSDTMVRYREPAITDRARMFASLDRLYVCVHVNYNAGYILAHAVTIIFNSCRIILRLFSYSLGFQV